MTPELLLAVAGLATLAGADLFWVLLLLGVAAAVPQVPAGPGLLADLGLASVIGMAALLHVAERLAEARLVSAIYWKAFQGVARPLAGALLGAAVVSEPWFGTATASVVGGTCAGLTHALTSGIFLRRRLLGRENPGFPAAGLAEDGVVAAGTALVLWAPVPGGVLCSAYLLGTAVRGGPLLRLARFGIRLASGGIRHLASGPGWRSAAALPPWAAALVKEREEGEGLGLTAPDRVVPGGVVSGEKRGPVLRGGWLAAGSRGAALLVGGKGAPRAIPVAANGEGAEETLFDRIPVRGTEGRDEGEGWTLLVGRDGPGRSALLAALGRTAGERRNPP